MHGIPVPDRRFLTGTIDLAAAENGGRLVACSDAFYGSPANLILPGRARHMGEGWENARRRDDGHDWAVFAPRRRGRGARTSSWTRRTSSATHPAGSALSGPRSRGDPRPDSPTDDEWFDLVVRRPAQPDTRHRFIVGETRPVTHVRLDVYPDGGMARMRVWGELA